MAKLSNTSENVPNISCIIDTDILINWLCKETGLWEAPHQIIQWLENVPVESYCCLTSLMELRFVLKNKKGIEEATIKNDLTKISNLMKILIPDELSLIDANRIQEENPTLSLGDAVLVATAVSLENSVVISRDKNLLKAANNQSLLSCSPEGFIEMFGKEKDK